MAKINFSINSWLEGDQRECHASCVKSRLAYTQKGNSMLRNIRQLVDRFYEIVNGADGDFSEIFTSDFQFGIMKGFPYGGNHNGLIATEKFFEDFSAHFEFWTVETDRFIEVDDANIVVTGKYISQACSTGTSFEMETVHLWTADNGMLTSYKHFCDTAIVSKALDHIVPQYS